MICEIVFDNAPAYNRIDSGITDPSYSTTSGIWAYHFDSNYVNNNDKPKVTRNGNTTYVYDESQRGNCTVSRTVSKNLMPTTLPVDSYYEGGLAADTGFADDSFSVSVETYSWDEYRYVVGLVKSNTGLRSGVFRYGISPTEYDEFIVAVRNCNVTFAPGKGFYCKISLTLMVVNHNTAT